MIFLDRLINFNQPLFPPRSGVITLRLLIGSLPARPLLANYRNGHYY